MTAFRFTLFESAKVIVQWANVMKMELFGFGLAHMRTTTNCYFNGNNIKGTSVLLLNDISLEMPLGRSDIELFEGVVQCCAACDGDREFEE